MSDLPINPLRRRMIEDMTIRRLSPATQRSYLEVMRRFAAFLGRSPDHASADDLRHYQLLLASNGASAPSVNVAVAALRFFFRVTLERNDADHMPFVREPHKSLPDGSNPLGGE
jgi:integrase/recombinase XerD